MNFVVHKNRNQDASVVTHPMFVLLRVDRKRQFGKQKTFFEGKLFFRFLFVAQSERVSVGRDCASTDMQISRSRWQDLCVVVRACCHRSTSPAPHCACRAARRSQTTNRPATTVSGNSFSVNYFFLFSFSHRANAFCLMGIARRTTCRSAEARGKTCSLLYVCAATRKPALQRSVLVVLHVDCKRRIGQQQQSRGILFREIVFLFS